MFLVFLRILNPASKSKSFSLHNIYDSLKHFAKLKNDIIKIIISINIKNVHYDLTNFFVYNKEQKSIAY